MTTITQAIMNLRLWFMNIARAVLRELNNRRISFNYRTYTPHQRLLIWSSLLLVPALLWNIPRTPLNSTECEYLQKLAQRQEAVTARFISDHIRHALNILVLTENCGLSPSTLFNNTAIITTSATLTGDGGSSREWLTLKQEKLPELAYELNDTRNALMALGSAVYESFGQFGSVKMTLGMPLTGVGLRQTDSKGMPILQKPWECRQTWDKTQQTLEAEMHALVHSVMKIYLTYPIEDLIHFSSNATNLADQTVEIIDKESVRLESVLEELPWYDGWWLYELYLRLTLQDPPRGQIVRAYEQQLMFAKSAVVEHINHLQAVRDNARDLELYIAWYLDAAPFLVDMFEPPNLQNPGKEVDNARAFLTILDKKGQADALLFAEMELRHPPRTSPRLLALPGTRDMSLWSSKGTDMTSWSVRQWIQNTPVKLPRYSTSSRRRPRLSAKNMRHKSGFKGITDR